MVEKSGVRELFSNVDVILRTNCSGERSFSTLSRDKSQIYTSMSDDRLNVGLLSLLCINREVMHSID